MNKFREMMRDSTFIRWSFFILFNAVLLYIMFSVIKNLGDISEQALKIINTIKL